MSFDPLTEAYAFPASFSQERLWFLDRLQPGSPVYNIPLVMRLAGRVDPPTLERALAEMVRRHESLRTRFAERDGEPLQLIAPDGVLPLRFLDLRDRARVYAQAEAQRLLTLEARRPFDLSRGPLARACLLQVDEAEALLGVVMHHIVSDGWSMGVFFRELSAFYEAFTRGLPPALPELRIQYADYAHWQRGQLQGERLAELLAAWKERLAGAPELTVLPTDRPRPAVESHRGEVLSFRWSSRVAEGLRVLARARGATLFMALLAGLLALLQRATGEDDLVVGTPVANRTRPEIEGLIGFFVNTLVLRTDLSGDPSFATLVDRVREGTLGALAYQELPFEKLVEELRPARSLSHNPLFQVMFVLQTADGSLGTSSAPEASKGAGEPVGGTGTAKLDLTLSLAETAQGIEGAWEFSTDLFEAATIQRLSRDLQRLLEAVTETPESPGRKLSEIARLAPDEEWRTVAARVAPAPAPWLEGVLHELFAAQAARTPDAIALVQGGRSLTYRELDRQAGAWAGRLRERGVGPETGVALLMERSPEAIIAMLAVLRAGGFFVPLDPGTPALRLRTILEDAGVAAVLTQPGSAPGPDTVGSVPVIPITVLAEGEGEGIADRTPVDPRNLAYAIYTSGSTGLPKGVLIEHAAVTGHCRVIGAAYELTEDDRVLQFAALSFDAAIDQIFATLLAGARLVLRDVALWSPHEFLDQLVALGVTAVNLPPAYWREVADVWGREPDRAREHRLRLLAVGGDRMPLESLPLWRQAPTGATRLVNVYGPTEATVDASLYEVPPDFGAGGGEPRIPIGRALPGRTLHVLDRHGQPVAMGASGELFLGGQGLARGYLGWPEGTAERFVPDPFGSVPGARLYRTGDLCRQLAGGTFDLMGRIDAQIKLRGLRIEPGEIEAALARHPGVRHAVVLPHTAGHGEVRLIAYVAGAAGAVLTAEELRSAVAEWLPAYMVPSAFVLLDEMPATPAGKIDRRALPPPPPPVRTEGGASATPTEEALAAIWCEVLGVERLGSGDSFFELGGHSLSALRVASRIAQTLGVELPVRTLFELPRLAALAAEIDAALAAQEARPPAAAEETGPPLVRVRRTPDLPLSFAQERLWFLARLEPASPLYNVPTVFRWNGPLDLPALEESLHALARRHETLRTRFVERGGRPVLAIDPEWTGALEIADLRRLAPGERQARAAEEARRPLDLAQGPLFRAVLLRLANDDRRLLLVLHHIATDAWSMEILVRDLGEMYAAVRAARPPRLPELPVQYADFAVWQRAVLSGATLERLLGFWRGQLAGAPQVLELPADRPRPAVPSHRGGTLAFRVADETAAGARELARREEATDFMVLLAAFQALLLRSTGQEDLVAGTPIANRPRYELEELIGFFSNTLVLRTDLSGSPSFRTLVGRVRRTALDAFAHQDLPFERLVEELRPERRLSVNPLFQVLFSLTKTLLPGGASPPEETGAIEGTGTAKFDLILILADEGHALSGAVEFASDLFDEATVRRLIGHFQVLLGALVREPGLPVDTVPLLTEEERHQLAAWNLRPAPPAGDDGLDRLFARQVAASPEAVALVAGEERLTYHELDRAAASLARRLRRLGVGPEVRVGLCLERSARLPVALLAVLRAGGAYVPLDPGLPSERLAFLLADARVALVLAERATAGVLDPFGNSSALLLLDEEEDRDEETGIVLPPAMVSPDQLAYILYTSGSTGRPKGVAMAHRPLLNLLAWQLGASAVRGPAATLQFASPGFDVSFQEIFSTWLSGGTLVLAPEEARRDPAVLVRLLAGERIERLFLPFVALRQLADAVARRDLAGLALREVITAGEALQVTPSVASFFARLPGCLLRNQYGPTETHVVTDLPLQGPPDGWDALPTIGRPMSNLRIWILDRHLGLLPVGIPGEIHIGGAGIARGYLGRPDLTAERFLPDPWSPEPGARMYRTGDIGRTLASGEIQFLGRADFQVKIRGFRVEVGEVETVLAGAPGVAQAVVTAERDASGAARLIAYAVAADGGTLDAAALRQHVRERLPDYMVPALVVPLAALPKTATGKVDRRALPAPPSEAGGETAPPRTSTERELARIFGEVLGRTGVGAAGDFFALGGHSLLATQAISRIRDAFDVDLPVRTLFELPTPERLAVAVTAEQLAGCDPEEVDRFLDDLDHLSEAEAAERLATL